MPQALSLKPFISSAPLSHFSKSKKCVSYGEVKGSRRLEVVAMGMLAPRKFMQRRKKVEVFKDATDEAEKRKWWRIMNEIEKTGSAVSVLRREKVKSENLPRDLVLGTLVRFKQMKSWDVLTEILEWLRIETWWDFNEMDFLMLITAYGKLGDFNKAETVFSAMTKKGYAPSVISHTALLEAYGKGGRYSNAEAIFRRMLSSGPEPSALTYQIMLKTFVEANKYEKAEEVFETLLNAKKPSLKPDAKMFHMMIYMYKKAGSYEKARKLFASMAERGVPRSTATYNSLMSFETNYKEVSNIYDQMQRADIQPDVLSYAMLINAYGKARREEEALAVFEEMLDAGVRPTQKAYNILLDAFAISGMVEQARNVFKSMQRDRCKRDICSYTTMLSAYVNASDMEGAEKFFRRIKQDGFEPNVVTYGVLIKGYARINELEKMMDKYKEMRLGGIKANQTIFTIIMDAYGKNENFGSAVAWYKQMESSGLPPDQKAKNILLSLAETREEKEEANELVGYLDHCNNEQKINEKSTFDYEDGEDDEIEDYGFEESDEARHAFSPASSRAEEYVLLNGNQQHTLETLQSLSSLEL